MNKKIYKNVYKYFSHIPHGRASETVTEGCLVLEGGGWKGLYTVGVLDALMLYGINLSSVTGCSAGALSAIGYLSGQIGWGVGIDLTCRHDPNYCGLGAYARDGGITGFSYLFRDLLRQRPLDKKRLNDPSRRLAVSATNVLTGELTYFEKGKCSLSKAIQASATVPYVSKPVYIHGIPYLDGGCAEKIPYSWAEKHGEEKKIVVVTREREYRRKPGSAMARAVYGKYPGFVHSLEKANERFNDMMDMLESKADSGEIILIAPSEKVTVSRFDGDIDKLASLYFLGMEDTKRMLPQIREYLGMKF